MAIKNIKNSLGSVIPQKMEITPIQGDKIRLEFDWCEPAIEDFVCRLSMSNSLGATCTCLVNRDTLITALRVKPLCYDNVTGKTYHVEVRGVDV